MRWFEVYKDTLIWSTNGRSRLDIDRGNFLRRGIVYLSGQLDLAGGTVSGTARSESPGNVIREIRVVGNDIGNLKQFDGSGLFLSTRLHNRVLSPVIVPAGGEATDQEFNACFTVDFLLPAKGNIRPIDTLLDTRRFSTLKLEIDWSANLRDALFTGNDRTEANPAATALIMLEYERPHSHFGEPMLYMQYQEDKPVTVAAANYSFPLSVDERYKNIIMLASNKAAAGQYTGNDAVITDYNLRLNSNIYPYHQINFVAQQYKDCLDLEFISIHAGVNFNVFDKDKMLREALNTIGGSSLEYIMTVTIPAGDNKISLYPGIIRRWPSEMRGQVCEPTARSVRPIAASRAVA